MIKEGDWCIVLYFIWSLSARDEGRGQAAVEELKKEGLSPKFHQLDITDHASIVKLAGFLKEKYGGIDILVNNAGIAYKVGLQKIVSFIVLVCNCW